jgi:hypothetical protein
VTNTKSYKQLQQENKDQELRIRYLTKKYVKKQPREQIKEKNVIYILTTNALKKERRYILFIATLFLNSSHNRALRNITINYTVNLSIFFQKFLHQIQRSV